MAVVLRCITQFVFFLIYLTVIVIEATSQRRHIATIKGDMIVGALFSVHHSPDQKQAQTRTCGDVREGYGIQRVEAAFQTIDKINNDPTILPNTTLGIEIRDSCWYSPIALEQSIEFIRDAISTSSKEDKNDTDNALNTAYPNCPKPEMKNLVGMIGPGSSTVTIQVQNLLQLFNISQIGYSATSSDLSDKSFYKYFLRVVPSDKFQAQVLVDILKRYNWTYISTVYTDGNYGVSGIDAFKKQAQSSGICVASGSSVYSKAPDIRFDEIIKELQNYPNARVVVCFCEGMTIRGLLKSARRLNASGEFLLIGSDGWSDRKDVVEEYGEEAWGGISIRIHSEIDLEFDDYYFNLKPCVNKRNPWFDEFWEYKFNCSLRCYKNSNKKYVKECTGNENLRDGYKQDTKMEFVKKAIYTMAYGLHNMQKDMCKETHGTCATMSPINGSVLLQYLMNVTFSWNNEMVKFDENGDPPGRYDIMNYQKMNNKYDYVKVGSWIDTVLKIDKPVQWGSITNGGTEPPESVCSKPCSRGEVKNIVSEMVQCCWKCVKCKDNAFVMNETTCQECSPGYWPNENLTGCDEIPVEYIHWWDTTAVVSMSIACLGFVATVVVMIVFIRHNNTPVVKASTRELSYIIMVGMYLCYATTIVLLARPTKTSCFLSRVLPGLSFSMIYTALVTKTNRIARILAGSKKKIITKKPRFMSATAQVIITLILISIEGAIIATMLILEPANSKLIYPAIDKVQLTCNTTTLGIIAPLGFDFFLIAMCTVYAVKTRNVPENFNEAKFIGFTMYTTLVIWLAFVPIYFGSNSNVITMCLCISFSAIVTLVLLYVPKVYIIIFRPERNNRSAFTTAKDVRCHIGYLTSGTTGVSRNSSQTTSDFSLESPRNHSLDIHVKQKDSSLHSQHRSRSSLNLFERFRLNKQEKNAATIAEHIRAIRAAEALDRKSKLRHTDSGLSSEQPKLAAQRSTSSGDESPGCHEKRKLVGLLKQTYGSEAEEIPGFDVLQEGLRTSVRKRLDDASCQTSDDLLDFWIPVRRRRIVRSETLLSTLTPEEEATDSNGPGMLSSYHTNRRDGAAYDAYNRSRCYPAFTELSYNEDNNFVNHSIPNDYYSQACRGHIKPCFSHRNPFDRVEVEYKLPSVESHIDDDENPEDDVVKESILLGDIEQQNESIGILSNSPFYNKMRRMDNPLRDVKTDALQVSEMATLNSMHSKKSEESLVDGGASSIVEESASSGSEDTPGSGIYRNIIISLGSNRISGAPGGNSFTGAHTSEARASAQKPDFAMLAESDSISSSRIKDDMPRSIRLRPNTKEGKFQPS